MQNWAGNYRYAATALHRPETVAEVQEIVAGSAGAVRALGSRHSFNGVADTTGALISQERLDRVLEIAPERRTVTVEGGARYGTLARRLHAEGFALPNLASLPHISVAGAVATATHGSGNDNACLAAPVRALEFVAADGSLVSLDRERDGDAFRGAVVSLGGLGIVTRLTLDVVPTFAVRQDVYENLSFAALEENFDAVTGGAYSVSLFTDWAEPRFYQAWLKSRVEPDAVASAAPADFFGAVRAERDLHPIPEVSAENCTPQRGIPGPWHERLPHFRLEFTPSRGEELQSEYLLPRENALPALRAVYALGKQIAPLLLTSEVRTVAADDLWLSPFCGRASVAFHFTWKPDWPAVRSLLPALEEALTPFDARPHWGKLAQIPPVRLRALYPRLSDFGELLRTYDPRGRFRNAFLDSLLAPP
jgi:FAD/FMN-containing dehydrogenases